jgi:hypothetical protein
MSHWRKSYPPTSQFNSFAGWMIGASMLVGALVFIARHVHVWRAVWIVGQAHHFATRAVNGIAGSLTK